MSDLIKREDAIKVIDNRICDNKWVCECAINSLPSAEPQGELISKDNAIKAVANYIWHLPNKCYKNFNSYNDIEEVVTDAIKQLPSTNDNWIPVSERLPEVTDTVLVQDVCGDIETAQVCTHYDGSLVFDGEWEYELEEVVAWMPLPTPYREENEE